MPRALLIAASIIVGLLNPSAAAATLQGRVLDSHGAVVPDATVTVQLAGSKTPEEAKTVHTDVQGRYKISLRAGSYLLRIGETSFGPYALAEAESKTVELTVKPAGAPLEFSDEPKFTVAGVSDHTYVGGHGSDAVKQSAEELTKATAALSKEQSASADLADSTPDARDEQLGRRLLHAGRYGDALIHFKKASQLNPQKADLHNLIAGAEESLGDPLDAVHEYELAAKLHPSETNLFDWGTELLIHQAFEPAADVFSRGNHLFPSSSRLLLGAGTACYARGEYGEAAQQFFAAADLHPEDAGPYLFLGQLRNTEITQSAGYLDRMARFAKVQPENAWANYYYATALWSERKDEGDVNNAKRVHALLETAVRLDPRLSAAYLQLGILFADQREFASAIDFYQKAIAINPDMEQAHYRLAQAYRQIGEGQKAQAENALFQKLATNSAEALSRERSALQRFVVTLKSPTSH